MSSIRTAICLLLLSGAANAVTLAEQNPGMHWPAMREPSPACQASLVQARQHLATLPTTSLMAVRDGQVLFSHQRVVTAAEGSTPRKVSPAEFLRVADMLAQAPCL